MSSGRKQDFSIGHNLKALRRKAKLSQREASARMEVMGIPMTEDILAKTEQGRYSIRIRVLLAMKQIYGVSSFDRFFDGLPLESQLPSNDA
jgi:transcriptional regulator with XRE-family HTH domain